MGTVDRPFAGPGDIVELRLHAACDGASPGFAATAAEHVVTIVFTPPNGARNVVVLAADCDELEAAGRQACAENVDSFTCVSVNATGDPIGLEVRELEAGRALRFRFPDTDALVGADDDGRTLTGPAVIAVSRRDDAVALSCELAAGSCSDHAGFIACVDRLFELDGSCDPTPGSLFTHFTALPPPNDFQALCVDPSPPCTGMAAEARLTIDADGNVLLPMDWRGILVGQGVPIARLLRASTSIEGLLGSGQPLRVPSNAFLRSFSPEGGTLPPLFDPQADPDATVEATFFGTADAPATVLRIARLSPTGRACAGGAEDGRPCDEAKPCGDAACTDALPLFDFGTRLLDGIGPIVIPRFGPGVCEGSGQPCADDLGCPDSRCVAYRAAAQDPVPLEGLASTEEMLAFVVPEAIEGRDLNGDGDTTDHVIVLADRRTGERRVIGLQSAAGRAVTRIRQPPFSFPAVAVDGDVVAFLESEPLQGATDANQDGDVFDPILRIFRLEDQSASDVTPSLYAIDAAPLVNDRSLAISGDDVYFRVSEAESAHRTLTRVRDDAQGGRVTRSMALSADGRLVSVSSCAVGTFECRVAVKDWAGGEVLHTIPGVEAENLSLSVDGRFTAFTDADGQSAFVHDAVTGEITRVSVDSAGTPGIGVAGPISADGRFATVVGFLGPEGVGGYHIYVHDRWSQTTTLASIDAEGVARSGRDPSLSADGRFVAFTRGSGLPGEVLVRDLLNQTTRRITDGDVLHGGRFSSISSDGRFVAFQSFSWTLVPGDTNYLEDIFVHDLLTSRTERVSVASDGTQRQGEGGEFGISFHPAELQERVVLSADGRFVVFSSLANHLVAGDTDEPLKPGDLLRGQHIYRHDRLTGATQRIAASAASQLSGFLLELSADGQVAGFASRADLGPEDPDAFANDAYVWGANVTADDPRGGTNDLWDLTRDGDLDDVVLMKWNRRSQQTEFLGPAQSVKVAGAAVAFLRPEAAGAWDGTGPDLDGDGDTDDIVAQLGSAGSEPRNLGRPATAIALSPQWLAALVPEPGDAENTVVQVHRVNDPPGSWIDVGEAADTIAVSNAVIAFITPEAARGDDLNNDGDADDRIVQLYFADTAELVRLSAAAEEMVLGDTLLAFRTPEAAQQQDLNSDGDRDDHVLQVYDLATRRLLNTGQAALRCDLEACDPRVPYRVLNDTVKFLIFEADQGEDLDGDGDSGDLLLQTFNARMAQLSQAGAGGVSAMPRRARTVLVDGAAHAGPVTMIGSVRRGICTSDGAACVSDADCDGGGTCHVPPGICLVDLGVPCIVSGAVCPSGFCVVPTGSDSGSCFLDTGACASNADCQGDARCREADNGVQRLVDPLAASAGEQVFTDAGQCVEDLDQPCSEADACASGYFCGAAGTCRRVHGTCRSDADCIAGSACAAHLIVSTARDSDADEIADPFDNCPLHANILQEDSDGDGIGDACEQLDDQTATPSPTVTASTAPQATATGPLDGTPTGTPPPSPTVAVTPTLAPKCTGDCNGDRLVTVDELVRGIAIALGSQSTASCPAFDASGDSQVTIDEIVTAVNRALGGCGN